VLARIALGGRELGTDLSRPVSLARQLDFEGAQPQHFGAPAASARPFEVGDFKGAVARGASCNCEVISLIPHCNGTHTECVGHLTRERLDASAVAPLGLLPALVVTVDAEPAAAGGERSDPDPQRGDLLITRGALERAWPRELPFVPRALIVRTSPARAEATSPYLTRQAAMLLVERGISELVVELPSIDRAHDEGRLTAHRIFFGLPPGATALAAATRPGATVTELARVPAAVNDGAWLLELQLPALGGDAVPCRPLLYPVTA
jgi:arylformamidase